MNTACCAAHSPIATLAHITAAATTAAAATCAALHCHRHDLHGIISVQTAQLMEEVAETPAPVTAPDATAAAAATDSMEVEGKEAESKGDSKVLLLLLLYCKVANQVI
jgi:hypothetical protein